MFPYELTLVEVNNCRQLDLYSNHKVTTKSYLFQGKEFSDALVKELMDRGKIINNEHIIQKLSSCHFNS